MAFAASTIHVIQGGGTGLTPEQALKVGNLPDNTNSELAALNQDILSIGQDIGVLEGNITANTLFRTSNSAKLSKVPNDTAASLSTIDNKITIINQLLDVSSYSVGDLLILQVGENNTYQYLKITEVNPGGDPPTITVQSNNEGELTITF